MRGPKKNHPKAAISPAAATTTTTSATPITDLRPRTGAVRPPTARSPPAEAAYAYGYGYGYGYGYARFSGWCSRRWRTRSGR
ncbi:hypothetical protein SSP35_11_00090 [Streptomyces sp. NBRC 110611]|nr:hypothetical protein SSP35_11_00090 [Streptomyces sp. NBRC 110611]